MAVLDRSAILDLHDLGLERGAKVLLKRALRSLPVGGRLLASIRNFVRDLKRGGFAPGLSATSFLLEVFRAPEDGSAVDLALVTRSAPRASPPRFAPPDNFSLAAPPIRSLAP